MTFNEVDFFGISSYCESSLTCTGKIRCYASICFQTAWKESYL